MMSITWHLDFPRAEFFSISPDVSTYVGLGRNYNIGAGGGLPFFINHISLAKYFEESDDSYWAGYMHFNQVFGANTNPYVELGGMYTKTDGLNFQQFELGLGYGNGLHYIPGLYKLPRHEENMNSRFIPFIKYAIGGKDIALSMLHYHGLSKTAFAYYRDGIRNDTLIKIITDEVEQIIKIDSANSMLYHSNPADYIINFKNNDTLKIYLRNHSHDFYGGYYNREIFLSRLFNTRGYAYYYFSHYTQSDSRYKTYGEFFINLDSLIHDINTQDTVYIMETSDRLLNQYNSLNSFKLDYSIGLGTQKFIEKD